MKENGFGRLDQYRGRREAKALYEKLRHRVPLGIPYAPFWILTPWEIEGEDDEEAPF